MSKSNSRYNGLTIDMINSRANVPFKKVATVNGRDYYEGEKRPGYYRAVLITRDGVVKQGFWFSENEEVQAYIDRIANRKAERQAKRREMLASDSGVKVGDIFYAHWGYDETHIDYVKVVSINGRRAVFEDLTGTPGFEGVGDRRTKLIQGSGDNAYISLTSYANAYKTTLEEARRKRESQDVAYTGDYR
jgi:hypothetical protein